MLRIGLTGGIACGKSTVAAYMRELGCHVLDADQIAHSLIEPGRLVFEEVVREFGSDILHTDGSVDRTRLAAIVFASREKLERLNAVVHPAVIAEQERWLVSLEKRESGAVAVIEAALLIEAGYHKQVDRLVVVWCRPEQQLDRLLERGMSREEARQRITAQLPLDQKRALADDQIDCSGTLEHTRRQVRELVEALRQFAAAKH